MENKSILIKDTTKEERIALIKQWIPDDACVYEHMTIIRTHAYTVSTAAAGNAA